jgi:hypothetical protein
VQFPHIFGKKLFFFERFSILENGRLFLNWHLRYTNGMYKFFLDLPFLKLSGFKTHPCKRTKINELSFIKYAPKWQWVCTRCTSTKKIIKMSSFCYNMENVISLYMSQNDHIKRLPLIRKKIIKIFQFKNLLIDSKMGQCIYVHWIITDIVSISIYNFY